MLIHGDIVTHFIHHEQYIESIHPFDIIRDGPIPQV